MIHLCDDVYTSVRRKDFRTCSKTSVCELDIVLRCPSFNLGLLRIMRALMNTSRTVAACLSETSVTEPKPWL